MNAEYIMYKCQVCNREFILLTNEVTYSEKESRYLSCPFDGRHKRKDIIVTGRFDNLKECMEKQRVYKRDRGRVKQIK